MKQIGGYRKGSGRSKHGYYKGIYCGSTYELCWVVYALDHNINFTRFSGILENNGLKYVPDFLLDDYKTIIEIKGYELPSKVEAKTKVAEHHGFTVIVLREKDLQFAFDYVKNKFGTKNYHILYDNFKPKHEFKCTYCQKIFSRDVKYNVLPFCSKSCFGLYNTNRIMSEKGDVWTHGLDGKPLKLTKEQALEIYHTDKLHKELAFEYGVSRSTVTLIKSKKIYKWIHYQ